MNYQFILSFLITFMFLIAGYNKTNRIDNITKDFQQKISKYINLDYQTCYYIILLVIVIEIAKPIVIMYSAYTKKYNIYAYYLCLSLAIFTILATLLYHYPINKSFYSNMSVLGGLLLLSTTFNKNGIINLN
jgi:uncharacterized membrane protein YphA (DoxX/SURF4 family)